MLKGCLYYHSIDKGELVTVDTETLGVKQVVHLGMEGVLFSDGDQLGIISATRDVSTISVHS